MDKYVLETSNLTKKIKGKTLVNSVNLKIRKGEVYGFLGPNGAGKTTTIKMILGLIKPSNGVVKVFNKNAKMHRGEVLKRIGSLVESPSYYAHLTARENLETLRRILQVPKSRVDEVLEIVRLTKDANRQVKQFSLGMKQRIGIASALLGSPELLILDEPTNGLDPSGIHEMRELIKSLAKKHGITVLVSSHLLSEIENMATHVGIILNGALIFQDTIQALRNKASNHIAMRVSDTEKAGNILLSRGLNVEIQDESLYLTVQDDDIISLAISELVHQNIPIYRVEENRQSLEDIFLNMTKGEVSL